MRVFPALIGSFSVFLLLNFSASGQKDDPKPKYPADWTKAVPHEDQNERLIKGLAEAEAYRKELLRPFEGATETPGLVLHRAVGQFVRDVGPTLREKKRPILSPRFNLSKEAWLAGIEGSELTAKETAFETFAGKWWGLWDGNPVDHDWGPTIACDPRLVLGGSEIESVQYAWIGDGFGWNVLCRDRKQSSAEKSYILGTVYHIKDGDRMKVTKHRPHVGIAVDGDKLIWLTRGGVFLEEIVKNEGGEPVYVITGFFCHFEGKTFHSKGAFQSIYTRDPENRPPWQKLPALKLEHPEAA